MNRNKIIPLLILILITCTQAIDDNLPVQKRSLETVLQYEFIKATSFFDKDGEKKDWPEGMNPTRQNITALLKYGILEGFEAGLALPYIFLNEFWDKHLISRDENGFAQVSLGLKYVHHKTGLGAFSKFYLPTGKKQLAGEGSTLDGWFTIGVLYGFVTEYFMLLSSISYMPEVIVTENNKTYNDYITFLVKPEWLPRHEIGININCQYQKFYNTNQHRKSDFKGYSLSLAPGGSYQINEGIKFEANIPISLSGKYDNSVWGIKISAYYNLGSVKK